MNKEQLKEFLKSKAIFTIDLKSSHIPIEGNCSASGDDDFDRECEQMIYDQLNSGNEWAWCDVKVGASFQDFEGFDYLGACSYESEQDFLDSGYFEDMKAQALDDLAQTIIETESKLETIRQHAKG